MIISIKHIKVCALMILAHVFMQSKWSRDCLMFSWKTWDKFSSFIIRSPHLNFFKGTWRYFIVGITHRSCRVSSLTSTFSVEEKLKYIRFNQIARWTRWTLGKKFSLKQLIDSYEPLYPCESLEELIHLSLAIWVSSTQLLCGYSTRV